MSTLTQFDEVREKIKGFLPQYLSKFGIDARDKKRFSCLSPTHADRHPSCSVIPGSTVFHCFSCGFTGDIFDAAAAKENKPLSGRGFVTDNLMYLAKTFGVNMPELNLSDEELTLIETRRAYAQASRIITQQPQERSEQIAAKLKEYMWSEDVIQQIGIGSVKSFADYWKRMTEGYGHSPEFLASINLDAKAKGIFSPHCLIYTVRDEHGSPIAFSARNLNFAEEEAVYKQQRAAVEARNDLNEEERTSEVQKLWKPRKYVNSAETAIFKIRGPIDARHRVVLVDEELAARRCLGALAHHLVETDDVGLPVSQVWLANQVHRGDLATDGGVQVGSVPAHEDDPVAQGQPFVLCPLAHRDDWSTVRAQLRDLAIATSKNAFFQETPPTPTNPQEFNSTLITLRQKVVSFLGGAQYGASTTGLTGELNALGNAIDQGAETLFNDAVQLVFTTDGNAASQAAVSSINEINRLWLRYLSLKDPKATDRLKPVRRYHFVDHQTIVHNGSISDPLLVS